MTEALSCGCTDGDYTLWLVIDTNILIEDLEHLKDFHRQVTLARHGGPFKDIHFNIMYYIPKKVNSELCAQKERGKEIYKAFARSSHFMRCELRT